MYLPPSFRMGDEEARAFIRAHSFAVLVSAQDGAHPVGTHIPFLLEDEPQPWGRLVGHMARANTHWRELEGRKVLAVFSGPHTYISPRWYAAMPNVPTWNYLAVHVMGTCCLLDGQGLKQLLDKTVAYYETESQLLGHLDDEYYANLRRAIVGFSIAIEHIDGKKKLSQNRPDTDRLGVLEALEASPGAEDREVAALMRRETGP